MFFCRFCVCIQINFHFFDTYIYIPSETDTLQRLIYDSKIRFDDNILCWFTRRISDRLNFIRLMVLKWIIIYNNQKTISWYNDRNQGILQYTTIVTEVCKNNKVNVSLHFVARPRSEKYFEDMIKLMESIDINPQMNNNDFPWTQFLLPVDEIIINIVPWQMAGLDIE